MPDFSPGELPARTLIDEYFNSHYDVRLPGGHRSTVRIGQPWPLSLREFLCNAANATLVSACNPYSVPTAATTNRARMRELLQHVGALNPPILPGVGHVPGQAWRESFVLLADLDNRDVDAIARRFGQNAVVRLLAGQPARLRMYRPDWRQRMADSVNIEWAPDPRNPLAIAPVND